MASHFVLIAFFLVINSTIILTQNIPVNCTRIYRNVHRQGPYVLGQLTIPMSSVARDDDNTVEQGFKLQISLNKAVRSVHVRQAKAREMGTSHTNFMIDTTPKEGAIKLDTVVRLRSGLRQHPARVVRVIYNGKALCGQQLTPSEEDESVTVNAVRVKTTSVRPKYSVHAKELDDDYY